MKKSKKFSLNVLRDKTCITPLKKIPIRRDFFTVVPDHELDRLGKALSSLHQIKTPALEEKKMNYGGLKPAVSFQ